MPTLTQLEYIVAVDDHRHFGRASESCHVSQPTLSAQILKVEDEFGFRIFDRQKKPILPTDQGARLIEHARSLLREHQRLMDLATSNFGEVSGEFRLGVIPTLAPYLLPKFLPVFAKLYPKVRLTIDEMKTDVIVQELMRDKLDAGLMATPLTHPDLKEEVLFYEGLSLYLSADHPLLKKDKIVSEDLDGRELWLLQEGHCFRNQVAQYCSVRGDVGVLKNVRFEAGSLETLKNIVKKSYGYTLLPSLSLQDVGVQERRAHVREFKSPMPVREISLVVRRDHWKENVVSAASEALKKTALGTHPKLNAKTHFRLEMC